MPDLSVLQHVRDLAAAYDEQHAAAAHEVGLNRTDGRALDVVATGSGLTAGELAVRLGITSGATTAVVDRLVAAGFATRVKNADDRRLVRVMVSPLGLEVHQETWRSLSVRLDRLLEPYSPADRETVLGFLASVRQALEPAGAPEQPGREVAS